MNFLKENKRFSFKLDGKNVWSSEYKTETFENNNELVTTYYFNGGLKVTNVAKNMKSSALTNG